MIHFFRTTVSVDPNNFSRKEIRVIPNSALLSCIKAPERKEGKVKKYISMFHIHINVSKILYSMIQNDFHWEQFKSCAPLLLKKIKLNSDT